MNDVKRLHRHKDTRANSTFDCLTMVSRVGLEITCVNAKLFYALQLKFDAVLGNCLPFSKDGNWYTLYWNCLVIQLNFRWLLFISFAVPSFNRWFTIFHSQFIYLLCYFIEHLNIFTQLLCISVDILLLIFLYLFLFFIFLLTTFQCVFLFFFL